jgi:hypothetical protein
MKTRNAVCRVLNIVILLALLLGSVPVTAAPTLSRAEELALVVPSEAEGSLRQDEVPNTSDGSNSSSCVSTGLGDIDPPAVVVDLVASTGPSAGTVDLSWTAPGDDASIGTASAYIVRYNTATICEDNWDTSIDVAGKPTPSPAGSVETMTVSGLTPGHTYHFAIKTQDEIPNTSGVSNSARGVAHASPNTIHLPLVLSSATRQPPVIPDTTQVLTQATTQYLSSISGDGAVFTFTQSTPALADLAPGDVIVGDATVETPYGFLRKVTSVSSVGGQVVVETEAATLEDAIESGEAHISRVLTPGDIQGGMQAKGVTLAPARFDDEFYFTLENVVLYDEDDDLETTDDQITANGSIRLEPSFDFGLVVKHWELEELFFTTSVDEKAELEIKTEVEYPIIKKEKEIARYLLGHFTVMIGPVPVVVFVELTVNVGVDGSVHVGVSTGVTQEATLTAGLRYADDTWTPVADFSNEFDYNPPTLSAGLDLKGYAGAQLSLLLYGVTGPYAEVNTYLKLHADISETPWWKLYGGLEMPVGVKVKVLSHVIAGYEATVIDYELPLAQALSNTSPDPPSAPSPADGATGVSTTADLSWTGGDPDPTDTVAYDVYFEADDSTPDNLICHDASTPTCDPGTLAYDTDYYWYVIATDDHGASTTGETWEFTTGSAPNNPPHTPDNPSPADGATEVSITADLSWTGGDPDAGDTVTYDVYFGTSDPPTTLICDDASATTCDPGTLAYDTHHYWYVIATDDHGAYTRGETWELTTGSAPNNPPHTPDNPSPADGATGVSVTADLSWTGGDPDTGDTVTYDVYFGTSDPPTTLICDNASTPTCDPGTLAYDAHYHWYVIATDNHGASTTGPVWDFATEGAPTTVTMDQVYTTDYWGNPQSAFRPGEAIRLWLVATNHGDSPIDVTYDWDVYDPTGLWDSYLSWNDWAVSMPPGEDSWQLTRAMWVDALLGTYAYSASVSYASETSSGSTTFDVQGTYIDINLLEALTCKDLQDDLPVDETDTFTSDDDRVYAWTAWEGASASPLPHTIRFDWYRPDGTLHTSLSDEFDFSPYSLAYLWSWVSVDYMIDYPGQWHVDFYMDDSYEGTLYFTLVEGTQSRTEREPHPATPSVSGGSGASWPDLPLASTRVKQGALP